VKKELIGKTLSGTSIYRVDGPEVRNTLDINFALGAHGLIKDYIPPDEIWVEAVVDECANMGHEIREYERMKGAGLPYDKAHEEANQFEHLLRQSGTCSVENLLKTPANPEISKLLKWYKEPGGAWLADALDNIKGKEQVIEVYKDIETGEWKWLVGDRQRNYSRYGISESEKEAKSKAMDIWFNQPKEED
jgi:hypothetical protein